MSYKINAFNALELRKLVQYSFATITEVIELEKNYILIFSCNGKEGIKAVVNNKDVIKSLVTDNKLIDSIVPIINNIEETIFEGHTINSIVLLPTVSYGIDDKIHLSEIDYLVPYIDYYKDLKPENSILKFEILDYQLKEYNSCDMFTFKISDSHTSCEVKILVDNYHVTLFPELEEINSYDGAIKDFIEYMKQMYKRIDYFKSKTEKDFKKRHKLSDLDESEFWKSNLFEEMNAEILAWVIKAKEEIVKTKKKFTFSGLNFLTERVGMSQYSYMTKEELEKMKQSLLDSENYEEVSKL